MGRASCPPLSGFRSAWSLWRCRVGLRARAAARWREIAVRLAIGAGRGRLVRQLLTETMLLFVLGGAGGLLFARGLTSLILSQLPALPVPVDVSLALDGRVIAFTIA